MRHDERRDEVAQVRDALGAFERRLDADTLRRLRAVRERALAEAERRSRWYWPRLSASLGGAVLAGLLVVAIAVRTQLPLTEAPVQDFDTLEIMAMDDNLELYEDLEFYYWLAEQNGAS